MDSSPSPLSEAEYLARLRAESIPSAIIATSSIPLAAKEVWPPAGERDLSHNYHLVRMDDGTKKRAPPQVITFDVSIDFRNCRLPQPSYRHDALTRRILYLELLRGTATKRRLGAASIPDILRSFDWILRHRNSMSIPTLAAMTDVNFKHYITLRKTSDITSLVPLAERLDSLLMDNSFELPFYKLGYIYFLDWDALADTLGVNRYSMSNSRTFKMALETRLPRFLERSSHKDILANLSDRRRKLPPAAPSIEPVTIANLAAWDSLDRLSIRGLLSHDALSEPLRVCRRPFGLSYAAIAGSSSVA